MNTNVEEHQIKIQNIGYYNCKNENLFLHVNVITLHYKFNEKVW